MKNSNQSLHVNNELCVDVKTYTYHQERTHSAGRNPSGSFFRTDEDHFTFVEKASEEKGPRRPIVHVFCGDYVNVVEQPDGRLLLSFRKVGSKERNSARFEQSQARLGIPNRRLFCPEEKRLDFMKYCLSVIREISQIVRMTKF